MKSETGIQTVIWDWNGTLLDDVDICVSSINVMLGQRNLETLDRERYREWFGFPVIDYYRRIGIDFSTEDFSAAADEYMALYFQRLRDAGLVAGVTRLLREIAAKGMNQLIISAMRQEDVDASVFRFGIKSYFSGIYGARDHYAHGKIEHARQVFLEQGLDTDSVLLIGDTSHDAELAFALQCRCVLFSGGHFARPRLESTSFPVMDSIDELTRFLGWD